MASSRKNLDMVLNAIFKNSLREFCVPVRFSDVVENADIINGIRRLGYRQMTKIQSKALPILLRKQQDVVIFGGAGKTFAACIAMLNHADASIEHPHVLCITATKEGAVCTYEILQELTVNTNISVGLAIQQQFDLGQKLKCQILVGSPKEMVALKIMRIFDIEKVSFCVFDDADVVTTTNLVKNQIITRLDKECRKLVISYRGAFADVVNVPYTICTDKDYNMFVNVEHYYIECSVVEKFDVIRSVHKMLVEKHESLGECWQAIIFCDTCFLADTVAKVLNVKGVEAAIMHSNMTHEQRTIQFSRFNKKEVPMMVTTNLMARGIKMPSVRVVINYFLPYSEFFGTEKFDRKAYHFRSTRCQQFDCKGLVLNLVADVQTHLLEPLVNWREEDHQIEQISIKN